MRRKKISKLLFLVMVSGLLLISLLFFVSTDGQVKHQLSNFPATLSHRLGQFFDRPQQFLNTMTEDWNSFFATVEENKSLKKSLSKLTNQQQKINDLLKENKALRQQLGLKKEFKSSFILPVDIISRSSVSWLDFVSVNQGRHQGVTSDLFLVSNQLLVGKVTQVNDDSSQVILLSNTSEQNPIAVKVGQDKTAVYGILLGYDEEKQAVKLGQFNKQSEVSVGEPVVTSGYDGGVANLTIGQVIATEHLADQSLVVYASIKADLSHLTDLQLIGRAVYE